jgi:uncharacterized membrane protein YccC
MSFASSLRGTASKFSFTPENRHHGLQLAAAVLLSYGVAWLLNLPEQLWAVMSTLIVMRPQTGATLEAGGDRLLGTLAGILCALAGVALHHWGIGGLGVTLAVVALLAYASAMTSGLRSAPVAALIVLSGGAIPGHSAWQVAGLRLVQIGIGVAVALAISLLSARYRAAQRLHAGSAALLRQCARLLVPAGDGGAKAEEGARQPAPEDTQDAAGAALRTAVGRLTLLAASADREGRLFRQAQPAGDGNHHRRIAGLLRRVVQDAALLARVLHGLPDSGQQPLAQQARQAGTQALAGVAQLLDALAEPGHRLPQPALGALRQLAHHGVVAEHDPALMLAAPVRLLLADLQRLCHVLGAGHRAATVAPPD